MSPPPARENRGLLASSRCMVLNVPFHAKCEHIIADEVVMTDMFKSNPNVHILMFTNGIYIFAECSLK